MFATTASVVGASAAKSGVLAAIDVGGYLTSTEFFSILAGLIGGLFSGLANALISGWFATGM